MKTIDTRMAGLIHDMRNLMTTIAVNCSLFAKNLPQENATQAAEVCEAVSHLNSMLTSLARGKNRATSQEASEAHSLIHHVVGLLAASYSGVDFCLDLNDKPMYLDIEENDLFRLLMNVVSNAAEAASNSSRDSYVRVSTDPTEGMIRIADSGTNIEWTNSSGLFEPYVSRRRKRGVHEGLGLFVVQTISSAYGGNVAIERRGDETVVELRFLCCPESPKRDGEVSHAGDLQELHQNC